MDRHDAPRDPLTFIADVFDAKRDHDLVWCTAHSYPKPWVVHIECLRYPTRSDTLSALTVYKWLTEMGNDDDKRQLWFLGPHLDFKGLLCVECKGNLARPP